jgi:hypothetical protein
MITMVHIPSVLKTVFDKAHDVLSNRASDPFDTFYNWGTTLDINTQLIIKAKNKVVKYPLGWLFRPFDEYIDPLSGYYAELSNVKIFFVMQTTADKTDQQRTNLTFTNRLYPFAEQFLIALENSPYFSTAGMKVGKKDFPYHDGRDGKGGNIFPEATDVVQITLDKLKVNENVCADFAMRKAG